uniref:Uncharacterized protein n=1 Tax=Ditylum brightwellii TaxID=49249 RepID=A0A7S4RYL0_9STRA
MMEMVLMQAMHVYSIGMEMPGHRGGMTWMEKQQVICLVGCVALSSDGNNLAVGAKGFGHSVALSSDGDILAVGGWLNDGNGVDAGHARVFHWNGNAWAQRGNDLDGEAAGDEGLVGSVALSSDGHILAVGTYLNDGNGVNAVMKVWSFWLFCCAVFTYSSCGGIFFQWRKWLESRPCTCIPLEWKCLGTEGE